MSETKMIPNPDYPQTGRIEILKVEGDIVFYRRGSLNPDGSIEWRMNGKVYQDSKNGFALSYGVEL